MRVSSINWDRQSGWHADRRDDRGPDLVFYFGSADCLRDGTAYRDLRDQFPAALLLGCSSYGHLRGHEVKDDGIAAAALSFDRTPVRAATVTLDAPDQSYDRGLTLGRELRADDLAAVFVLSCGLIVNGSELVNGLVASLGPHVKLSGALAADDAHFVETLVGADNTPRRRQIVAVGFYGSAVRFGHGSAGGWDTFGPHRRVTRAEGNILYELDGKPALELYERYLGEEAAGLPGTGLIYPLKVWDPANPKHDMVRSVLAVDRAEGSMRFAGDVPNGFVAQLMRGAQDHLVAGAEAAAEQARASLPADTTGDILALMVSCIGRRLLMGQRTEDEVEAAALALPPGTVTLGCYANGEIAPHAVTGRCGLHNQTMTITLIGEA